MKIFLFILLVFVIVYIGYQFIRIKALANNARELINTTSLFQQDVLDYEKSVLVIGDSVSYGVGASSPETSLPGYIGQAYPDWEIVNNSESGREISGALKALHGIGRSDWDLIILQISGNDIFHLNSLSESKTDFRSLIELANKKSDNVIYITTGSIGYAPLIPQPFDWLYTKISKKYLDEFIKIANSENISVVDNYRDKEDDIFETDPDKYYASDKFHPSDAGYQIWFNNLNQVLLKLD